MPTAYIIKAAAKLPVDLGCFVSPEMSQRRRSQCQPIHLDRGISERAAKLAAWSTTRIFFSAFSHADSTGFPSFLVSKLLRLWAPSRGAGSIIISSPLFCLVGIDRNWPRIVCNNDSSNERSGAGYTMQSAS